MRGRYTTTPAPYGVVVVVVTALIYLLLIPKLYQTAEAVSIKKKAANV
jgi:hypothetical protein